MKFGALICVLALGALAEEKAEFHYISCEEDCCFEAEECLSVKDSQTLDECLKATPTSCKITQQFKITGATCVDKYVGAKVDSIPTLPAGFSQVAQPKITGLLVEDSSCKKYSVVKDPELDLATCATKASVPEPSSDIHPSRIIPLNSAADDKFEVINLDCDTEQGVAPIITVEPIPGELSAELLALPLETGDSSEGASEETTEESGGAATDESEESTAEGNTEEGAGETTEEGESTEEGSEETSEGGGEEDTTEEGAAPGETTGEEAGGETTEPTEEEGGTEEGAIGSMFFSVAALSVYALA